MLKITWIFNHCLFDVRVLIYLRGWQFSSRLSLHVTFVLQFGPYRLITFFKFSSLAHKVSHGPSVNFPSLFTLVFMSLKQVFVWSEIWHDVDFDSASSPAQVHDCKRQEFHNIETQVDSSLRVFHECWSDCFLCKEGSLSEFEHSSSICGGTFRENEERRKLSCGFNEFLSVSDSSKSQGLLLLRATSWDENRIDNLAESAKKRNVLKILCWRKGWSQVFNQYDWV